jgi:HlyD family secretion protein
MRRRLIAVAVLAGLGIAAFLAARANQGAPAGWQGYVEGELLRIGPEGAGRIVRLAVAAGDRVKAGAELFTVDDTVERAQLAAAEAQLVEASARRDDLRASQSRPEQVAVLKAAVARAEAELEVSRRDLARARSLVADGAATRARLDAAQGAYDRDRAALEEARRQVSAASLGGREAAIAAAEANVAAAEASREEARRRLAKRVVAAPADAPVEDVYFRVGETVAAGQAVLALLPDENRKVRFYVPEPARASIALGNRVRIACDGCAPDLVGTVTFLAHEAEFTPPVIYSRDERAKLVFKVEARLGAAAARLPLGLPVDVRPAGDQP